MKKIRDTRCGMRDARWEHRCWRTLCFLLPTLYFLLCAGTAHSQEVVDVSDPGAIKIKTPDQGVVVSGTLHDTLANYPALKEKLLAETVKKLEAENEMAAARRMGAIQGQKVQLPKAAVDKHNARIAKFGKAKEEALNGALKKAKVTVTLENTMSQEQMDAQVKALTEARALAQKAKARKDELTAAGIPITEATQKAVEAAQPKPNPPPPVPSPTPDDGL